MIFYMEFGNKLICWSSKYYFGFFYFFYFPKGIWGNWHFLPFDFFFTTFLHCDDIDVGTHWKAWNVKV